MYILKNYSKLYNKNYILKIYYYLNKYPFIIYLNNNIFNNKNLLNFKIELLKFDNKCFILNTKYIKYLFNYKSFKFLGTNIIVILFKSFESFLLIKNYLEDKKFFYSYKKNLGMKNIIKNILNLKNNVFLFSFIIFKLILYIILLILYIIYIIIKL